MSYALGALNVVDMGKYESKHEWMCDMTRVVAAKSTCLRKHVGAVFCTSTYSILATGYNSSPRDFAACEGEEECLKRDGDGCERTSHAELNAIIQAARRGTPLQESVLYVTLSPCLTCAKVLINLPVTEIRYDELYRDTLAQEFLSDAGIPLVQWGDVDE